MNNYSSILRLCNIEFKYNNNFTVTLHLHTWETCVGYSNKNKFVTISKDLIVIDPLVVLWGFK